MNYTIFISMVMNYFRKMSRKSLMNYLANEDGLVAIEYALIGSLIAVAIIVAVSILGNEIVTVFNTIITSLNPTATTAPPPNTVPGG